MPSTDHKFRRSCASRARHKNGKAISDGTHRRCLEHQSALTATWLAASRLNARQTKQNRELLPKQQSGRITVATNMAARYLETRGHMPRARGVAWIGDRGATMPQGSIATLGVPPVRATPASCPHCVARNRPMRVLRRKLRPLSQLTRVAGWCPYSARRPLNLAQCPAKNAIAYPQSLLKAEIA